MKGFEHIRLIAPIGIYGNAHEISRLGVADGFANFLLQRQGAFLTDRRDLFGQYAQFKFNDKDIAVYKPNAKKLNQIGYMISWAVSTLRIDLSQVMLAHYDVSLPLGTHKILDGERYHYNGYGMITRAFTGRHSYVRLALGIGKSKVKCHADTFILGRARPEEWKNYWKMYRRIYAEHFAMKAEEKEKKTVPQLAAAL